MIIVRVLCVLVSHTDVRPRLSAIYDAGQMSDCSVLTEYTKPPL